MENFRLQDILMVQSAPNAVPKDENHRTNTLNFAIAFRPIYYFSRIFGRMPFTIVHNSNGEIQRPRITAFDIIWLFISLCVYSVALISNQMWKDTYVAWKRNKIFIISNNVYALLEVGFCLIGIIMDLFNRYKIVQVLNKFTIFDKKVKNQQFGDFLKK